MSDRTILVVDDEEANREFFISVLRAEGYCAIAVASARDALGLLACVTPDLLLVDVMMPGMDGLDFCRLLKAEEATRLIPLVLVTALDGTEDRVRGIEAGADDYLAKPVRLMELRARVRSLLRMKQYVDQLENAEAVLFSLALGVEAKDPGLEHHCARLAHYATALGRALGLDAETLEALRRGGVLHDVGKIGVPDAILFKAGGLTSDEWQVMREHPVIGERICRPLRSMQGVLPIIRHHHERWNGSGYPDGLAGPAIPLPARILQVADVFDALTATRPYRGPLTPEEAVRVLRQEAAEGSWDRDLVELFARLLSAGLFAGAAASRPSDPVRGMPPLGPGGAPRPPRGGENARLETRGGPAPGPAAPTTPGEDAPRTYRPQDPEPILCVA